jgi:hypothetical protein
METITWLTDGDGFSDYRPVFSPDGSAVLFERTPAGSQTTTLHILTLDGGVPEPFLKDAPPGMETQTRPDWGAGDAGVAFCIGNNGPIGLANGDGTGATALAGTDGMIYPSWFAGGETMAVMTHLNAPYNAAIDRTGTVLRRLTPDELYAGMPSVSQQDPSLLAFPGQPAVPPYNQLNNQIYIGTSATEARKLDGKQGRAPWWAPDGELLVFESDRASGSPNGYAIFASTPDGSFQVQLTDPQFNAQHAKFSPDGKKLVLAAQPRGTGPGHPWAIGTIPLTR